MLIIIAVGNSFQLQPGERLWDYSDPVIRNDLEDNWSDYLEGEWRAKNTLTSFEATYYEKNMYESAQFSDKVILIDTINSDKIILPEEFFGEAILQFDNNAKIITLVDEEKIKDESSEGFRKMTYSGELNRTTNNRFILTLDLNYHQHIDNIEDNPWGEKGKPNIVKLEYRIAFIKEVENGKSDTMYSKAVERVSKAWDWLKKQVAGEEFRVPPMPSATAGVRG